MGPFSTGIFGISDSAYAIAVPLRSKETRILVDNVSLAAFPVLGQS